MVAVGCEQVWQEISNYLEGEVDPTLRSALEDHLGQCRRCTAVLEGTRNVVEIYGDERLFQVPMGYSWRLKRRLAAEANAGRRTVLGWLAATAAIALVSGTALLENRKGIPALRSEHAQPGHHVPQNLEVLVNTHGKLFHIPGCPFMSQQDETRSMIASEAVKEGYVPCVRCLGEYVSQVARFLAKRARVAV